MLLVTDQGEVRSNPRSQVVYIFIKFCFVLILKLALPQPSHIDSVHLIEIMIMAFWCFRLFVCFTIARIFFSFSESQV